MSFSKAASATPPKLRSSIPPADAASPTPNTPDWSNRLARGFVAAGLKPGEVIAIFLPNSWEFAIAYHAATLAGGIPTLLNPSYREREIRYQLENSGAVFLITDAPTDGMMNLAGLPALRRVYTTRLERPGCRALCQLAAPIFFRRQLPEPAALCANRRRASLLQRHHGIAKRRHALASQSGRQCLPSSWSWCGTVHSRRHSALLSAAVSHLRPHGRLNAHAHAWRRHSFSCRASTCPSSALC